MRTCGAADQELLWKREGAWKVLEQALSDYPANASWLYLVSGPSGVGKSFLTRLRGFFEKFYSKNIHQTAPAFPI